MRRDQQVGAVGLRRQQRRTRYADGDARGLITVPSHLILRSGLALAEGRDCAPAKPKQPAKRKKKSPTDGDNKRKLAAEGARCAASGAR